MPATRFEASAPGKLILMGEHAAVYGRPALVAALELRTRARVEPARGGGVDLDLPDLGCRERVTWEEVIDYGRNRREDWRRWHESVGAQDVARLSALGSDSGAGLVKVAVAEALRALGRDQQVDDLPGVTLSVNSDVPRGAGFGSSASVAVAVGAALLGSLSAPRDAPLEVDDPRIEAVAMEVEKRQHGRPSGVDHTAVIRGGFLAVAREEKGLRATDLPRPDWLRSAIRVFDTGTPAESTGAVVEAVRRLRDREPDAFADRLDRMERATSTFMGGLAQGEAPWPALLESIVSFEHCLEQLGVVPGRLARVVRRIEAAGGAAKISGAGSLSGEAAGSLLVLCPPETPCGRQLDALLGGFRPIHARLGSRGIELSGDADA